MADSKVKDGGYCVRCDTVWASPGKCRCFKEQTALVTETGVIDVNSWNAAIEAAAKRIESLDRWFPVAEIRRLKK